MPARRAGTLNVRTTLSADTSVVRGLFIEMFLTTMLMITILLLAAEKHKATFLAPIGIGASLFSSSSVVFVLSDCFFENNRTGALHR
jgi:glycerol uptake facilitator-like aquaporin